MALEPAAVFKRLSDAKLGYWRFKKFMEDIKMTKAEIIEKFAIHEGDTGSPEVLIALLKMVGRRRGLQNYLKKTDIERYRAICAALGLRK